MSRAANVKAPAMSGGEFVIENDAGTARAGRRWLVLPALVFGMMSWIALDALLF